MLTTLAALASKYLVPALLGWITGWLSKVWHNIMLKNQAKAETAKAIDNAEKNNDTSGVFGG